MLVRLAGDHKKTESERVFAYCMFRHTQCVRMPRSLRVLFEAKNTEVEGA